MALTVAPETLADIWEALNAPSRHECDLSQTWQVVAREGWIIAVNLEDTLLLADGRLDRHGLTPRRFTEMLELPWRWVFHRPDSRFDEPTGFQSLAASDAAALLILFERLGFHVDAEPLCRLLRPTLREASHLTHAQLDVLFHDKSVLRTPPLTLSTEAAEFAGMTTRKLRTARGYRVEYTVGGKGTPMWLTVTAPKYRARPEPTLTECEECGLSYVKGLPSDDKEHRRTHLLRRQSTHPEPHRRFVQELERDPLGAAWVDETSAGWKHELMHRRAFAFKREAGYDFSQWGRTAKENQGAVGYLFSDDDGRVIGAAGFRPEAGEPPWRLDWVWLAPDHRRSGHLTRTWEAFRQRFGDFAVEHPLSDAMKAFLRKQGAAHLIRGGEAGRDYTED